MYVCAYVHVCYFMNVIVFFFVFFLSITSLETVDHAHQMYHLHLKTRQTMSTMCLYESLVCQRDTLVDTVYTSHKVYTNFM